MTKFALLFSACVVLVALYQCADAAAVVTFEQQIDQPQQDTELPSDFVDSIADDGLDDDSDNAIDDDADDDEDDSPSIELDSVQGTELSNDVDDSDADDDSDNDDDLNNDDDDDDDYPSTELDTVQGPMTDDDLDYHYHYDYHHHDYDYHHHDEEKQCSCSGDTCDCCVRHHNFHIHVNGHVFELSACVNVTYVSGDKYEVTVTYNNDKLLSTKTIDLSDPPRMCYNVPTFRGVEGCVKFYDVSNKHACIKVTGQLKKSFFSTSIDLRLGCFTIPGADQDLLE